MDSGTNHLGDSVFFQDVLPLQWRAIDSVPPDSACARMATANDHILQLLETWEEIRSDKDESENSPEWRKIDAKLNLLLDCVGQMLRRDQTLPDEQTVRMFSQHICWESQQAPQEAQWVQLEVYLFHYFPQALIFCGRAQTATPPWTACVALECGVPDSYEKFLFRRHRRAVAMQKSKPA